MKKLNLIWRHHPWLSSLFILAALATIMFAVRSVVLMVYWADPSHRDRALEPWMTPRYVVNSWQVPPEVVAGVLGQDLTSGRHQTLSKIARDQGLSIEELNSRLIDAATAYRARQK